MRSLAVVLVMSVDVELEVAGPGPCIEGFLDFETSLETSSYLRFIPLMMKVKEKDPLIT